MRAMDERDALRALDWSGVYGNVPDSVRAGVGDAFDRIRARERRRVHIVRAACIAACFCLVVGAGLFTLAGRKSTDRITPPVTDALCLTAYDEVFAAPEDEYFHLNAVCPRATGKQVSLKLITAMEFEKSPCPHCLKDVILPAS